MYLRRDEDELARAVVIGEVDHLLDGDVAAHGVHEDVELVHHPEAVQAGLRS